MPTNHIPATSSQRRPHGRVLAREKLPGVRHIVAVASGKERRGIDGKWNLALALTRWARGRGSSTRTSSVRAYPACLASRRARVHDEELKDRSCPSSGRA